MPHPHRPAALVGRVFRGADAVRAGLLTPDQLRSSAWRRVLRGVYADAALRPDHGLQVRAAGLLAPPEAVFAGGTAAWLHGVSMAVANGEPVQLALPTGVRWGSRDGVRVRRVALPEDDVVLVAGRRVTSPLRTAEDVARSGPPEVTVPVLDVLLAHCGLRATEVMARLTGAGAHDARTAVCWADRRAESPQESRLRLVLRRAGLVATSQHVVRDARGGFVARVDLAFPHRRVAIEYDGAWHAEPGQFARDRRRLNALQAAGWRVLHVTAADLHDPERLVARVRALLAEPA